jgi:hypothetical protein
MEILHLRKTVTITGQDIFGRAAFIKFYPSSNPGWYWKCGETLVPINKKLLALSRNHYLFLRHLKYRLYIVEHILVLRWTGLDGIIIESSPWPPYYGRVQEMWDELREYLITTDKNILWINPEKSLTVQKGDRILKFITPDTKKSNQLEINVAVDFPQFGGKANKKIIISEANSLALIWCFAAKALFNNSSTIIQIVFGLLNKMGIWKHYKHVLWPRDYNNDQLLKEIVEHRAIDLLGALACFDEKGLPAGEIISYKGGHQLDIQLVKALK